MADLKTNTLQPSKEILSKIFDSGKEDNNIVFSLTQKSSNKIVVDYILIIDQDSFYEGISLMFELLV